MSSRPSRYAWGLTGESAAFLARGTLSASACTHFGALTPLALLARLLARLCTQVIARNALKQEAEEDIYLPDTIDVTEQRSTSSSTCGSC